MIANFMQAVRHVERHGERQSLIQYVELLIEQQRTIGTHRIDAVKKQGMMILERASKVWFSDIVPLRPHSRPVRCRHIY